MAKLSDQILKDLQGRKGGSSSADDGDPEDMKDGGDDEEAEGEGGGDEEAAMQEFMDAEDAAGKAAALKSFLKICYPGLGSK